MPQKRREVSVSIVRVPEIALQRIIQSGARMEFISLCSSALGPF